MNKSILLMLVSSYSLADCAVKPEHSFGLEVTQCQSAAFGIDLSEKYDWLTLSEDDKIQKGTIVSGVVSASRYKKEIASSRTKK